MYVHSVSSEKKDTLIWIIWNVPFYVKVLLSSSLSLTSTGRRCTLNTLWSMWDWTSGGAEMNPNPETLNVSSPRVMGLHHLDRERPISKTFDPRSSGLHIIGPVRVFCDITAFLSGLLTLHSLLFPFLVSSPSYLRHGQSASRLKSRLLILPVSSPKSCFWWSCPGLLLLLLLVTPWSRRAEGCRSSSRPATWSRGPAAPGWWSSCRGCGGSSSSWSSSGSEAGRGFPVVGEAWLRRLLLVRKCPWIRKQKNRALTLCSRCWFHTFDLVTWSGALSSWALLNWFLSSFISFVILGLKIKHFKVKNTNYWLISSERNIHSTITLNSAKSPMMFDSL